MSHAYQDRSEALGENFTSPSFLYNKNNFFDNAGKHLMYQECSGIFLNAGAGWPQLWAGNAGNLQNLVVRKSINI